jgi:hypothetical protein
MLAMSALVVSLTACGSSAQQRTAVPNTDSSSPTVALPNCERPDDTSTVDENGCLVQTALTLGYDGVAANSFRLADRICYDTDIAELVQQYGGGSDDATMVSRTFLESSVQ